MAVRFVGYARGPNGLPQRTGRILEVGGRWRTGTASYVGPPSTWVERGVADQQLDVLGYRGAEPVWLISGGIGSGKTTLGVDLVGLDMLEFPEKFWWVAPKYRTARVGFRKAMRRLPKHWIARSTSNEKDMRIVLVNGAELEFRSAVNEEDLEGDDCRGIVGDEVGRYSDAVRAQLRERIARNEGRARIYYPGTPTDELAEMMATLPQPDPSTGLVDGRIFELDSRLNPWVDPANFNRLAGVVNEREFDRVVKGRLRKRPGRVFWAFEPGDHVRPAPDIAASATVEAVIRRFPGARAPIAPIVTAWDFNVARGRPMVTLVLQAFRVGDGLAWWVVDEVAEVNTSIPRQARTVRALLQERYGYRGEGCFAVVDSNTREMKDTNVRAAIAEVGFRVHGAQAGKDTNPPQQASADVVNGLLAPADGSGARLFIAPHCTQVKRSLGLLMWGSDGTIDHGATYGTDVSHAGDALRYFAWRFHDPDYKRLVRPARRAST